MDVKVNGEYQLLGMGMVKEIQGKTVIFDVRGERVKSHVDAETMAEVKEILQTDENALFPIDMKTKTMVDDADVIENALLKGELKSSTEILG